MELEQKIKKAHFLDRDYDTKAKSIPDLLEERAERSDKNFMTFYDTDGSKREFTYSEFAERVRRTAGVLKGLGIGPGDAVSTVMYNHYHTVVVYFACWHIGATVVPINAEEDDDRLRFTFENADVKAIFFFPEFADRMKQFTDVVPRKRMVSVGKARGFSVYQDLLEKSEPAEIEAHREDQALVVYTSGTTGTPKGVSLTQHNLLIDADSIAHHNSFSEKDRFMCVLPIHHVNGITVTIMTPMYAEASFVLNRKFQSGWFWQRIADEDVTVVSVVPTLLAYILEASGAAAAAASKNTPLRSIICGAGPLTVELAQRFEDTFGIRITHGYGLSETTCYSCYVPTDINDREHKEWMRGHGFPTIGVPLKANEMDIHDEEGRSMKEDEKGEIVVRGKNVMSGYLNRPEANEEAFRHGWFRSGDEGFYKTDDQGRRYFFITGRVKELIIRGGVNISPLEVDEVLNSIPGVKNAIAVGFENKWYGEEVGAAVQIDGSAQLTQDDIIHECQKRLAFVKSPKAVVFTEDIPVTSTGKYQRNKLKPLFAEWCDEQFREER